MLHLITWRNFKKRQGIWWPAGRCIFSISRGCVFVLFVFLFSSNGWAQQLERIAHLPQWPGVSQLVVYNDRIWFVNSHPYKDNNVADIYSYSPDETSVCYERSLFSQDAGVPVVYEGLLYWPFEDPRRSAGAGEYAVTDGTNWQWRSMQSGSVMHVHAMSVCNDRLVAVTGAWTGQLHQLGNDQQWRLEYDYPAGDASFSRLVSVSEHGGSCIVGASARGKAEAKLFAIDDTQRETLSGWPSSDRVDSLVVHNESLFAFVDSGGQRKLLQYDDGKTHTISLPTDHRARALYSDGKTLWLGTLNVQDKKNRGQLWKYDDRAGFTPVQALPKVPIVLTSFRGAIAIGTHAASGGELWLFGEPDQSLESESPVASLSAASLQLEPDESQVNQLYDELLELLTDPASTADYARALRKLLGSHALIKSPEFGAALTNLLSVTFDGEPTKMFTDEVVSRQNLIRWYLITALAINGQGRIDPSWFNPAEELNVPSNGKLFNPAIAAIVASGWLKQNDNVTLAALLQRLNNDTDPFWVKSDVIGALTALTDQRFGYDVVAWNNWWSSKQ